MQKTLEENVFFYEEKYLSEYKTLFVYSLFLFLVPIILNHQLITGIIVNALLINASLRYSLKKVFLLCMLPSIAAATTGILFGGLTSYLIIMLPFIWVSNAIICFVSRKMVAEKKKNYFFGAGMAGILKTVFLFSSALALFYFGLVPVTFLTAFGIIQLITAESGMIMLGAFRKIGFLQPIKYL
jgi:hypothetical protein